MIKEKVKGKNGKEYTVYIKGKEKTCDCEDFNYRDRICKHIKQIQKKYEKH